VRPFIILLIAIISCSVVGHATALAPFMPAPVDVGDLTSDGSGGWNYLVRPLAPGETAPSDVYYPSDPSQNDLPPITPAQSSIALVEGEPLVLVLPNMLGLDMAVEHQVVDDQIHAFIYRTFGGETDVLWQPRALEHLHPLGPLDAGNYTLNLMFITSEDMTPPMLLAGFVSFTVTPIPSPGTLGMALPAVAIGLLASRWRQRGRH
jgi:hypothetical protein